MTDKEVPTKRNREGNGERLREFAGPKQEETDARMIAMRMQIISLNNKLLQRGARYSYREYGGRRRRPDYVQNPCGRPSGSTGHYS